MRRLRGLIVLGLAWLAGCGEKAQTSYPIWDGKESVEAYARRVNLPATEKLEVYDGVRIELVLVPAGEKKLPPPGPEVTVFGAKVLAVTSVAIFAGLAAVFLFARRPGKRFSFSLRWLLLFSVACGMTMLSQWRRERAELLLSEYQKTMKSYYEMLDGSTAIPFYMAKTELTSEQYWKTFGNDRGDRELPLTDIACSSAARFCETVSRKTGKDVRLPTEAQWEFACRAGTTTPYATGDTLKYDQATFNAEARAAFMRPRGAIASQYYRNGATPVAMYKPNAFGLYDMHGNVAEWCRDIVEEPKGDPLPVPATVNAKGIVVKGGKVFMRDSRDRVCRGGSWAKGAATCSTFSRENKADEPQSDVGFRVVVLPMKK